MNLPGAALLVISIAVGSLLALVAARFLRLGRGSTEGGWLVASDALLIGLLTLAAFAMGVFLIYILFGSSR